MEYKASTQINVKLQNQKIILQLLVNEGPMTRAELAKKMNSSKPTVSKNVDNLLQECKILEVGKDDNSVGKKGTLLDINADYGHVLAMDLSKNKFQIVIANLKKEWKHHYQLHVGDEDINVLQILKHFLNRHQIDTKRLMMAAIAFPGVVTEDDKVQLTNLKYREVFFNQLKPYIEEELAIPLSVKNDINLASVAEKRYGRFRHESNLYLLSADIGVGVGIIINHKLYEGDRNAAGEVGFFLPIHRKDGRYYTLEERVGILELINHYQQMTGEVIDYNELVNRVNQGEKVALELYYDVIEDVAVAITNIASVLDIKNVVVLGRLFELKEDMLQELNVLVNKMTPFETLISKSDIHKVSLQGAIVIAVEKVINGLVMEA